MRVSEGGCMHSALASASALAVAAAAAAAGNVARAVTHPGTWLEGAARARDSLLTPPPRWPCRTGTCAGAITPADAVRSALTPPAAAPPRSDHDPLSLPRPAGTPWRAAAFGA